MRSINQHGPPSSGSVRARASRRAVLGDRLERPERSGDAPGARRLRAADVTMRRRRAVLAKPSRGAPERRFRHRCASRGQAGPWHQPHVPTSSRGAQCPGAQPGRPRGEPDQGRAELESGRARRAGKWAGDHGVGRGAIPARRRYQGHHQPVGPRHRFAELAGSPRGLRLLPDHANATFRSQDSLRDQAAARQRGGICGRAKRRRQPQHRAVEQAGERIGGVELGARLRRPSELFGLRIGSQAFLAAGGGYQLARPRLSFALELYLLPSLIDSGNDRYWPAEWLLSTRFAPRLFGNVSLGLGGGGGLPFSSGAGGARLGFGLPSFRGLLFLRLIPRAD